MQRDLVNVSLKYFNEQLCLVQHDLKTVYTNSCNLTRYKSVRNVSKDNLREY